MIDGKACTKCGMEKCYSKYYKSSLSKDGHRSSCKVCHTEYKKRNKEKIALKQCEYKEKNRDKMIQSGKKYRENNRIMMRLKANERYKINKNKQKAQRAVQDEVKKNATFKNHRCESCNSHDKLEGHHEDYSKELDVIWLCKKCHSRIHSSILRENILKRLNKSLG